MKTVLATLFSIAALAVAGAAAFVYSGAFSVAATDPHWSATYWVMERTRMRAIQARAAGITPPVGYDEQAKVVSAIGHFSEHCVICHGGPGARRNEAMDGMYPPPPSLTNVARRYTPGELFWILKNGIKMSGMPSMTSDGDDMLWATVAVLQKLPGLSDEDYNDLWMASQVQGEQGGTDMGHGPMNMTPMDHGSMNMGPMGGANGSTSVRGAK